MNSCTQQGRYQLPLSELLAAKVHNWSVLFYSSNGSRVPSICFLLWICRSHDYQK
jgi:hypothetical protein